MKNKGNTNLIIDGIMFLFMAMIAGLGLLMKYVLLPGEKANLIYQSRVDLYFLGLDRHQWGNIHFILAGCLIALLIIHIILHWKMIKSIYSRMIGQKWGRILGGLALLLLAILLVVSPFFIRADVQEKADKHHNRMEYKSLNSKEDTSFHAARDGKGRQRRRAIRDNKQSNQKRNQENHE